jgi:hypothetical protein
VEFEVDYVSQVSQSWGIIAQVVMTIIFRVTMQSVTLRLPKAVLQQAQQAANALRNPLEVALAKLVAASFQGLSDAPPDMQPTLARMAWLSNRELWKIARGQMPIEQQEQMRLLAEAQIARSLTHKEQGLLDKLRQKYGQITLSKAHGYALLSLRSGRPLLSTL